MGEVFRVSAYRAEYQREAVIVPWAEIRCAGGLDISIDRVATLGMRRPIACAPRRLAADRLDEVCTDQLLLPLADPSKSWVSAVIRATVESGRRRRQRYPILSGGAEEYWCRGPTSSWRACSTSDPRANS